MGKSGDYSPGVDLPYIFKAEPYRDINCTRTHYHKIYPALTRLGRLGRAACDCGAGSSFARLSPGI